MIRYLFIFFLLSNFLFSGFAQIKPRQQWITHPSASIRDYGVFHFRKNFELNTKPEKFIINVSADNRYKLFVNGVQVSLGPARGDLSNWRYEQIDIAPYLSQGKNVLASIVWNLGENMPLAQVSYETAFVLWGSSKQEELVNSNETWKVLKNSGYHPIRFEKSEVRLLWQFYVAGACDSIIGTEYPWGWQEVNYDDSKWTGSRNISIHDYLWNLTKSKLPQMENQTQRFVETRRTSGIKVDQNFLLGKGKLIIPANAKATVLLDQKVLTTAYPKFLISGGKGGEITVKYAEALFKEEVVLKHKINKENRNEIEGRKIYGVYDKFYPDGNKNRLYETLWFRTFRYVQIEITAGAEPLIIEDVYSNATGYPYKLEASFNSNDPRLKNIAEIGWRTFRLCSQETFMDCPYYEQLQYIADARTEALVSYHTSTDDRLVRNALSQMNDSRLPNGLARSTHPSQWVKPSPTMSLYWVCMVHDYWMFRDDPDFIKKFIPGVRNVLEGSEMKIGKNGMVEKADFVDTFYDPMKDTTVKGAAATTLLYTYAFDLGATLLEQFGKKEDANHFKEVSEKSKKAVYDLCYNAEKKIFSDLPDKKSYSQHTNILAILSDAIEKDKQSELMKKILEDTSLTQVTTFYRFYMGLALKKTGMGNQYLENLKPWHNMVDDGLTTFSEWDGRSKHGEVRSDCHAWSSSPNIQFLSTVCGIVPAEPGFKSVLIEPALGSLKNIEGIMPHPYGNIKIILKRKGKDKIEGEITLPENLSGKFIWNKKTILLNPGNQKIDL